MPADVEPPLWLNQAALPPSCPCAPRLQANERFGPVVSTIATLNGGLWAAANTSRAEQPFIHPPHVPGFEAVANFSASPSCAATYTNYTVAAGVATLPTSGNVSVALGQHHGITYNECVSMCCTTTSCTAWAWYNTTDEGMLCQTYTAGYSLGPQPFPDGRVISAQGGATTVAPATEDKIANGLRSGTFLGGLATGGYEIRADGTFHLCTIRNQSPAGEPWQGVVRDAVLAVAINGAAHVVRLQPFGNVSGVPQIVYEAAFPVAKLSFLNLTLFAYSTLTPGNTNRSNTPAVMYTLRAHNGMAAPLNVTFMVARGLALRNDFTQVGDKPKPVPAARTRAACALSCSAPAGCTAWQWDEAAAACLIDSGAFSQGVNRRGVDSGNPGSFNFSAAGDAGDEAVVGVAFGADVAPGAVQLYGGVGSQGLYALPAEAPAGSRVSAGAGAAASMEALLGTLSTGDDPSALLNSAQFRKAGADTLFGAAAVTVANLPPGADAALSVAHAWHYPHLYWYRDTHGGSDVGVRYAATYPTLGDVVASLNVTSTAGAQADWQRLFRGLPDPVLRDAAANVFNHVRSAMWPRDAGYRQWESLEFVDWSNPTNGDERHLPYFHFLPEAMRSKLVNEVRHAQDANGMFQCVVVSAAGDKQWGNGDPCHDTGAGGHPDDITMVMVGVYELYALHNDTGIVDELYPSLVAAFQYYRRRYNATAWQLPYEVHETYDAVPESATVRGEGNYGVSLYNSVNYLTGLHCMREMARYRGDASTVQQAGALITAVHDAIERHFWQPDRGFYLGDTIGYKPALEANGDPWHSNDGLHGQVLAYRLGLGDVLPRAHMQAHQKYVHDDLITPWGLSFDRYAQQNWLMGDHSHATLMLRWHNTSGWSTSLQQMRYWRDVRKDASRHTAVINTRTGQYDLLNYYGYALFFYHTLSAWTGQTASLPQRSLEFQPHVSAFLPPPATGDSAAAAASTAVLPILFGGDLGTLTITPTEATAVLLFRSEGPELSFLNITVCQHVFVAKPASPWVLRRGEPLRFPLPSPCSVTTA